MTKSYMMEFYKGLRFETGNRYPIGTMVLADTKEEVVDFVARVFSLKPDEKEFLFDVLEKWGWRYCFSDLEENTVEIRPIGETMKKKYEKKAVDKDSFAL